MPAKYLAVCKEGLHLRLAQFPTTHMTFKLLKGDSECDCLTGASSDNTSTFICTVGGNNLKPKDFFSKWERYKNSGKELPFDSCLDLCGLKGMSINRLDGYSEDEIIEVYKQRMIYSSKSKTYIFKFNIGQNVGMVELTPNIDHQSHHDLFKCDEFDVANFQNTSVTKLIIEEDAA